MKVSALCGSFRTGSYNQSLLDALIDRAPEGLEIVQLREIREFPFFSQDLEHTPPAAVTRVKAAVQSSEALLLVSPEYDYSIPGYLKNAIDWLSRPYGDPTLVGRPLALTGASRGRGGTMRGQLAWRQGWHFFRAPVFSDAELFCSDSANHFDVNGRLASEDLARRIDVYLAAMKTWLERGCR